MGKSRSLQVFQAPLCFRNVWSMPAGLGSICMAKSRVGRSHEGANCVFLCCLPRERSSHPVVRTALTAGLGLLLCQSLGCAREDIGWAISLALPSCRCREASGVDGGERGQRILTVAMPKPLAFYVEVILAFTKTCVSLSVLSFCSPEGQAWEQSYLNTQEPDRGFFF